MGSLLLLAFGYFYWLGWLSPDDRQKPKSKAGSTWGIFSGQEKNADWEERKERVKDAFKLSWGAYEQHGWGRCILLPLMGS